MAEVLMRGDDYSDEHNDFNYMDDYPDSMDISWLNMLVQVLYAIICIVGLAGNTLVIYVVVRFSKMQTVTNFYIVNLAIADELLLIGTPFLISTMNLGYWPFGNIACKAFYTSTSIHQITSCMFLLIMSADRYLAVCHPIRSPKWRTPLVAKLVALTAWILSALIIVPIFKYADTLEIDKKTHCNIFWPESELMAGSTIYILYAFFLGFFIPFIPILIFYVLVICRLRTVGPKRRASHQSNSESVTIESSCQRNWDLKKSDRKVTKLVLTVITVYFACWFPFWVTQIGVLYMPQDTQHSVSKLMMFLLAGCLSYSNSAMNPILYAFLSDNFKTSFLEACYCAIRKDANAVVPAQQDANEMMVPKMKQDSDDHENPVVTNESTP